MKTAILQAEKELAIKLSSRLIVDKEVKQYIKAHNRIKAVLGLVNVKKNQPKHPLIN